MQHRVHPFQLADPAHPGHRRMLALFLVDPHQKIISTSNVPCQQKSWWVDLVRDIGPLGELPKEMTDQVLESMDGFPVSLEVSREQGLELMEERKNYGEVQRREFEDGNTFNLCEH